jgi:hypothetical protein
MDVSKGNSPKGRISSLERSIIPARLIPRRAVEPLTALSFPVGLAGRFLPFAFPPELLLLSTG